jgi:hypothetical protein
MRADRSDGVAPAMEMRVLCPRVMVSHAITRVDEELEQRMWVRVLGAGAQLHREQKQSQQGQCADNRGEPRGDARSSSSQELEPMMSARHYGTKGSEFRGARTRFSKQESLVERGAIHCA